MTRLWMRAETRATERRAPVVPADAAKLVAHGVELTVEDSPQRAFAIADYAEAGCTVAEAGSWVDAPPDRIVLGLKELPDAPAALVHRHVFFGHAFKGQPGAEALLRRFAAGGGELLDIEYLVDDDGRRLAAFGYWAGFVGAALAVLHRRGRLSTPLEPTTRDALVAALAEPGATPSSLVIGALGRSGRGARDALAAAGISPTCWDVAETRVLDTAALLGHDLLVNTVLTTRPVPPFVTPDDVRNPARRLSLVCDVTADIGSECNVLPIYQRPTTWQRPVERLHDEPPLEIIAIDNLPSLLPTEASEAFSAELTPVLQRLGDPAAGDPPAGDPPAGDPAWSRCATLFREAVALVR